MLHQLGNLSRIARLGATVSPAGTRLSLQSPATFSTRPLAQSALPLALDAQPRYARFQSGAQGQYSRSSSSSSSASWVFGFSALAAAAVAITTTVSADESAQDQ